MYRVLSRRDIEIGRDPAFMDVRFWPEPKPANHTKIPLLCASN